MSDESEGYDSDSEINSDTELVPAKWYIFDDKAKAIAFQKKHTPKIQILSNVVLTEHNKDEKNSNKKNNKIDESASENIENKPSSKKRSGMSIKV